MSEQLSVAAAIAELANNPEQYNAVHETGHCVVLAGPGSGKTKTLTVAMAKALRDVVVEPRGIACLTYNNECALELESRLSKLGIEPVDRVFIGTVHSFALSQVIGPYARCVMPALPADFRVATVQECRAAVEFAYTRVINDGGDAQARWRFAEEKRRTQVNRRAPIWRGRNPELADFVEAYEAELRQRGLIDFDDMPLMAYRMIKENTWIAEALCAKFPVLFIDEYQDLGYALHELVNELCFFGGMRLFAVGDADQSIYAFTGANSDLLTGLAKRGDVRAISLRFNYRCGRKIIGASMAALGEERGYVAADDAREGEVLFRGIDGDLHDQAQDIAAHLIPRLLAEGTPPQEIAVLYRTADEGTRIAEALSEAGFPFVRSDNQALVKRNSRLSRFIEACARWVTGGWRDANPPFKRLLGEAVMLAFGTTSSADERQQLEIELISFLEGGIAAGHTANTWLRAFRNSLMVPWRLRARSRTENWDAIDDMIARTDPGSSPGDMTLEHFGGRIEGSGRINLSTLHSAKGREFDVVIMFAMNADVIPSWRDKQSTDALRDARRLFYVGVTRPRKQLHVCYQKGNHSPWDKELYDRVQQS